MSKNQDDLFSALNEAQQETEDELAEALGLEEDSKDTSGDGDVEKKDEQEEASKVLTVRQFLDTVNAVLGEQLYGIRVKGEISRVNVGRGRRYAFLTVQDPDDESYEVGCFVPGNILRDYEYLLEEGMEVAVQGVPDIYKNGRFNIKIWKVDPVGEGALLKAFEQLKAKLEKQGYFAKERKRELPRFIKNIGLITSESGKAIRDFKKNLGEYGFNVFYQDVYVEGDYAEDSIVTAIRRFNKHRPDLDVLVVVRGGGGLQQLKAFNSEEVADAVFTSRLPILAGIGHEGDTTIAGLTADRRESTPTATAQFLRRRREELIQEVNEHWQSMQYATERTLTDERRQLQLAGQNLVNACRQLLRDYRASLRHTSEQLHRVLQRVFDRFRGLVRGYTGALQEYRQKIAQYQYRLNQFASRQTEVMGDALKVRQNRLHIAETALKSLNPKAVLERGYSISYRDDGTVVKQAEDLQKGDTLKIHFAKGYSTSRVEEVSEK